VLLTYLITLMVAVGFMTLVFIVALAKRRNDIADVVWGPGFVFVAVTALAVTGSVSERALLVSLLVAAWGIRLAWHIGARHIGKPEDSRYARWRREWGKRIVLRSFLQVFLLQGVLITIVSLPVTAVAVGPASPLGMFDALGAAIWTIGFFFEAVADWQLASFKRDGGSRGRFIMTGLWRWSRHPNYFGEVVLWWGIYCFALSTPNAWVALLGPLTITLLILKVSGVPMLEEKYRDNPDYQAYAARTSVFFPMPPRKER